MVALAERGEAPCEPVQDVVNLHCHTFFSFNAYGHSPTSLAWLAKKRGFAAVGIVDFDVLDAVDEFLAACDLAGVRGSAGIETRVFIPEFATREINSPGEPGVYYHMGIGFTSGTVPPEAAPTLAAMRARADRRNREMVARVNAYLDPVVIDYERDVLPLTPAGNATERHMLLAYIRAADRALRRLQKPRRPPSGRRSWARQPSKSPPYRRLCQVLEPGPRQADEAGRRGLCPAQPGGLPDRGRVPRHDHLPAARCRAPPGWTAQPRANRPSTSCSTC